MKLLVMLIAAALSIPALSDNHSPENPYLGFYYFSAPNPEAVVKAMDTFYDRTAASNIRRCRVGRAGNGSYDQRTSFSTATPMQPLSRKPLRSSARVRRHRHFSPR